MRRTVGLLVGAATVVALAGVAGAQTLTGQQGQEQSAPPGTGGPAVAAPVGPAGAVTGVLGGLLDAAVPAAGLGEAGRQRIGAEEALHRLLSAGPESSSTTLRYPGAPYVKVHLDRAELGRGGSVTVADPAGVEVYRYPAGSLPETAGGWVMSITGDTAVVTVERGTVAVDRVARGLTADELAANERAARERAAREPTAPGGGRTGREESICGGDDKSDAVCFRDTDPGVYQRSKAVVRLLINGSELCTGWRIGPNNRVITNHHCFADSQTAYRTEVWFNYQCARCRGYEVFRPTKVWGKQVLDTDRTLDLTLFTVENFAEVARFGHLELAVDRPSPGEEVFIPQHPAGEPGMVAARSDTDRSGACAVDDPAYDGYAAETDVSYYCDTEGGSSGSPVLSRRTGRVIALHHFGGCPNSGVRADLIHARLHHLL